MSEIKKEFVKKWSVWFALHFNRDLLLEAFERELDEVIPDGDSRQNERMVIKKNAEAKISLLKEILNDFKGINPEYHYEIMERYIDDLENPGRLP